MEGNNRVNLLFLDACRDNPLSKTLASGMGASRSSSIGRGLAAMKANAGTLISYSTKEGEVAADGQGKHSPFTEASLKHIEMPGIEIGLMLRKVRETVITTTQNKQVPWEYVSLLGPQYAIVLYWSSTTHDSHSYDAWGAFFDLGYYVYNFNVPLLSCPCCSRWKYRQIRLSETAQSTYLTFRSQINSSRFGGLSMEVELAKRL